MAKRSRTKPSRQQRKDQRVRSTRASEHGLPAAAVRPSRPSQGAALDHAEPVSSVRGDMGAESDRRGRSLSKRIQDVSLPVKVAIVAAVALAVAWVFAFTEGRDVSRPAPVSSVSVQPTPPAPPVATTPPVAVPSAPPEPPPPVISKPRATAPAATTPPPRPPSTPSKSPPVAPTSATATAKPPSDVPPRATATPGPPTSLSGPAKPLEQPPFVTPAPPAPPLPSAYPEPDPLGAGRSRAGGVHP